MFSDNGAGPCQEASGCASQDKGEGCLSLASYPLASELTGQGGPTSASGGLSDTPFFLSLRAFSTLASENSRAGNEASKCTEPP